MDDTAFFYSRTLRIIVILAIVVPLVVIGGLLWYFSSGGDPEPSAVAEEAAVDEVEQGVAAISADGVDDDDNPLQPVGPKASTRLVPGGTVCPNDGKYGCDSCG